MNKHELNYLKKFADAMVPALKELSKRTASLRIKKETNQ